jgi:hypothetical protein
VFHLLIGRVPLRELCFLSETFPSTTTLQPPSQRKYHRPKTAPQVKAYASLIFHQNIMLLLAVAT